MSSGGPIMTLINNTNTIINDINLNNPIPTYATEPISQNFTGSGNIRECVINRFGDKCEPLYIIMKQTDNIHRLKSFELKTNYTILGMDINFLQKLFPDTIKKMGNNIIYKLHFDKLLCGNGLNMFAGSIMGSSPYRIVIELENSENINEIQLLNNFIYLDTEARTRLYNVPSYNLIYQYFNKNMEQGSPNNFEFNDVINSNIKGVFIETENVNDIQEFKITGNGIIFKQYDNILLNLLCNKVNSNLLYIPLNVGQDIWDNNLGNALAAHRFNNFKIEVIGQEQHTNVKLHFLGHNCLKYCDGMSINARNFETFTISNLNPYPSASPQYTTIYKIYTGDYDCLITFEKILPGISYMECNNCNKPFIKNEIQQWVQKKRNCPHCRAIWTSNIVYINDIEPVYDLE